MKTNIDSGIFKDSKKLSLRNAKQLMRKGFSKYQILENHRKMYQSRYLNGNNRLMVEPKVITIIKSGEIEVRDNPDFPSTMDSATLEMVAPALHEKQQQLNQAIEINHGKVEKFNMELQEIEEINQEEKKKFINDLEQRQVLSPAEYKHGPPTRSSIFLLIVLLGLVVIGELASLFFPIGNFLGIDLSMNLIEALGIDPAKSILTFCFSLILFGMLLLIVDLIIRIGQELLNKLENQRIGEDPGRHMKSTNGVPVEEAIIIDEH